MKNDQTSRFNDWDPDAFDRGASWQKTIRAFTAENIAGDVLDIGCGSRVYYDLRSASSWTGLDVAERMLNSVQFVDKPKKSKFILGDARDIPVPPNTYDTVIACFLLHHLAKENRSKSFMEVSKAYEEAFRVLRPGGRFVVAENCPGPLEIPYHACFSVLYPLVLSIFDVELPYFWAAKTHRKMSSNAGFLNESGYVHVPIVEPVYQPVIGRPTPAFLNGDLIQKMTLFIFEKAKS